MTRQAGSYIAYREKKNTLELMEATWSDKEKQSATRFLGKNQAPAAD